MIKQSIAILGLMLSLTANAAIFNLTSDLNCSYASAGAGTCGAGGTGSGSMSGTLDDQTNVFTWDISWSGLSGTAQAVHIHGPATENQSGSILLGEGTIGSGVAPNPWTGSETVPTQFVNDLLAGLWYINVHTSTFNSGEIRGQIYASPVPVPAAVWLFGSALLGLIGLKRKM